MTVLGNAGGFQRYSLTPFERRRFQRVISKIESRYATESKYRSEVDEYGVECQVHWAVLGWCGLWSWIIGTSGTAFRASTLYIHSWLVVVGEVLCYSITAVLLSWGFFRGITAMSARSRWRRKDAPG